MSNVIDLSLVKTERNIDKLIALGHMERVGDAIRITEKGMKYVEAKFLNGDPARIKAAKSATDLKTFAQICLPD